MKKSTKNLLLGALAVAVVAGIAKAASKPKVPVVVPKPSGGSRPANEAAQ